MCVLSSYPYLIGSIFIGVIGTTYYRYYSKNKTPKLKNSDYLNDTYLDWDQFIDIEQYNN